MKKANRKKKNPSRFRLSAQHVVRKILLLIAVVGVVVLGVHVYHSHRLQTEQRAFEKADKTAFIDIVGKSAKDIAGRHDLYASVMVAQAILESDWGQSKLTKEANNLFGVKGSYRGQSYAIETQEDDGTGKWYTVTAEFRKYPTYHASLEDNADLLAYGVSWDSEFYAGTWKSRTASYTEATHYLQGRYATDTSYASKLNELIEQYDLTRFDE